MVVLLRARRVERQADVLRRHGAQQQYQWVSCISKRISKRLLVFLLGVDRLPAHTHARVHWVVAVAADLDSRNIGQNLG